MLYLGVNADLEAASDLDVPPSLLRESLDELLEAAQ
jgi:diacylglycerol O-acyltransferase